MKDDVFRLEMLNAMHKIQRGIERDFKETTKTWSHQPKWDSVIDTKGGQLAVLVGTDDPIYKYVNDGTKPHVIVPRTKKALRFPWDGYGSHIPKTIPTWIGSFPEQVPTNTVYFKKVNHPGNEARMFDEEIQKFWTPRFKTAIEEAMRNAAKKSGHGKV